MSGVFRFLLAYTVVVSHLSGVARLDHAGDYAVRGFFVLSGFAITAALNEVYLFDGVRFFRTRLMRIAPLYFLACGVTFLLIRFLPHAGLFMPRWDFHMNGENVLANFALLPLAFTEPTFRFIEPAWSIAVETIMYALLYLAMARSPRHAAIFLAGAVAYHVAQKAIGTDFSFRYFAIPSALLSYSIGSLIYFTTRKYDCRNPRAFIAVAILWFAHLVVANVLAPQSYVENLGYYLNTILAAAVVATMPRRFGGPLLTSVDKYLGELSYPVFLFQWAAAFVAAQFLPLHDWRGWVLVAATTPVVVAFSALAAWFNARFIEPARAEVRTEPAFADGDAAVGFGRRRFERPESARHVVNRPSTVGLRRRPPASG
jgi:peptidoglycan/LPS O-acetylase OafA/YrhL